MNWQNPEMDKAASKGLRPGASNGVVRSYNARRNPFGGYIEDTPTGLNVFVHRSAVEKAGLEKLDPGQHVFYTIIEDGFGGFKASDIALA